jgi:uncharacterized membrane protein
MPIGPVQLLVVSFDKPDFSGEILAELNRLRENEVIRLIDALAVQKNLDGTLAALQWSDLSIEEAEGLGATVGALLGLGAGGEAGMEAGAIAGMEAGSDGHLIDESEVWDVADAIEPGSAANLTVNPRAGLLFVDWETGSTLQLTGRAQIIWDAQALRSRPGAERLVEVKLDAVRQHERALPAHWNLIESYRRNPSVNP